MGSAARLLKGPVSSSSAPSLFYPTCPPTHIFARSTLVVRAAFLSVFPCVVVLECALLSRSSGVLSSLFGAYPVLTIFLSSWRVGRCTPSARRGRRTIRPQIVPPQLRWRTQLLTAWPADVCCLHGLTCGSRL